MGATVTERLRAVDSPVGLDAVLREIAGKRHRWNRDLVFYYLPVRWHQAAEAYFVDGILTPPVALPAPLATAASTPPLAEALRSLATPAEPESAPPPPGVVIPEALPEPPRPAHSRDLVALVLNALYAEIGATRRRRVDRYRVTDGVCVGARGEHYVYRFRWSRSPELHIPGDLRLPDGRRYSARVTGQAAGEGAYELSLETDIGEAISAGTFYVDPLFLLKQQYTQLHALADCAPSLRARAEALLSRPPIPPSPANVPLPEALGESQRQAICLALSAERSYVWGPPGTGKTTTLGELCRQAVSAGKRVLVVSPNNVAVDEALLASHSAGTTPEHFVRFGRVGARVVQRGIHLDAHLERSAAASGLLERASALAASASLEAGMAPSRPGSVKASLEVMGEAAILLRRLGKGSQGRELQRHQQAIRREFRARERDIVTAARVVGTTATLAEIAPLMADQRFDLLIVDEASIVRTSDIVLLVLKREGQLAIFGDPKQLPPIVSSRDQEVRQWLARNPFALAGIDDPGATTATACVFLERQHRMAPPIRSLVSDLFYAGKLEDGKSPRTGRVLLLDTSDTAAQCLRHVLAGGGTRENPIHRSIMSGVLDELVKRRPEWSIRLLTPFRGQRKALVEESRTGRHLHSPKVHIGTIHASQGAEAQAVVVDLTVAPAKSRSNFLDHDRNPDIENLINVALSRAKRLLVIVAHVDYCRHAYAGGIIDRLLAKVHPEDTVRVPATLAISKPMRGILLSDTRLSAS